MNYSPSVGVSERRRNVAASLRDADYTIYRFMSQQTDTRAGATIVVVPCYNEALRLDVAAYESFLTRCLDVTLLFVDDGSTDDTPLVIERLRQRHPSRVLSLRLAANVGKGEAVRRGMQLAIRRRATQVGYWDADLATPLDSISRFRSVLNERPELVMVMGSRVALLGRQIRRRWRRHMLGRAFATAASIVLKLPVYDTQCGAKLFRVTPETATMFRQPFRSRWIFDVEILSRLVRATAADRHRTPAIYEYPLEHWQEVDGSRLKALDFVVAVGDLLGIFWRDRRVKGATIEIEAEAASYTTRSDYRDAA